jgi:uncharacterized protein (TIGR02646 family)
VRTIDRSKEPRPGVLDPSQTATHVTAYAACTTTSGVKKHVYGHKDVVAALHRLFLRKCSLCESDASKDGVVEHFIPHCPASADLAYDWNNLHWTCGACNQRKKRGEYKEFQPGTTVVQRTLLIDATAPHGGRVEGMLWFDQKLRAQPTAAFQADRVVQLTTEFLNTSLPENERLRMGHEMLGFIAESECLSEWRAIIPLVPVDPATRPDPTRASRALEVADKLYLLFLHEKNPFSTSMRWALTNRLGLHASDIAELGRRHRTLRALPTAY